MEALCREQLSVTPLRVEEVYTYPKGQKKLTGVVLVDLNSEKAAQDLAKSVKENSYTVAGCTVRVGFARTELQTKRNTQLRRAAELVKAVPEAEGQTVEVLWGNKRQVKVGDSVVYQQDKEGLGGSFSGAFSGLSLA